MTTNRPPRLGHVAISADAPHRVAAFYRDLLDLQIVREASNPLTGDAVLLSGDPAREDHELVLFTNPAAQHIAFRVGTRDQLRALYTRARQHGLEIPYAIDSSVAIGFFLRDPAGNAIEVYVAPDQVRAGWAAPDRSGRHRPPDPRVSTAKRQEMSTDHANFRNPRAVS